MGAANVPLEIDQGEDWTANVIYTDDIDQPQHVIHPCRLDIKSVTGATQLSLTTLEDMDMPPGGAIPDILLSNEVGLLQLHIEDTVTAALRPGNYKYDLFVTVDDGNEYAGAQIQRIIYGDVTVRQRVTQM